MSRWVYDIECNDLYLGAERMWILVAYNLDTDKIYYWLEGDLGWIDAFSDATLIVGHNIIMYDNLVLKKLFNFEFPKNCKIRDTLIESRVLDYRRFGDRGHSLAEWGRFFNYPKIDFHDFSQYSEEMKTYCIRDVNLNVRVYQHLRTELAEAIDNNPLVREYLRAEVAVSKWCAKSLAHGWPFDTEKALILKNRLQNDLDHALNTLEPRLGFKAKPKDKKYGIIEIKEPKWTKAGVYEKRMADYFEINPYSGFEGEEKPIAGPYVRVEVLPLQLSSSNDVKTFLFRNGWEPSEYNYVWDDELRALRQTSPKIVEEDLEFLGGDGKLYKEYLTADSRFNILKGWLENTDANGFLHGDCKPIGTPSMRATHNIIVNVPAGESKYGREMRELFGTIPGWTLIGCDSASNQARGLAHFLNNDEFTDTLINGDIHTYNANILDNVLKSMDVSWDEFIISNNKAQIADDAWSNYSSKDEYLRSESPGAIKAIAAVKRAAAKRILYAFLFGASGKKLWSYIFGTQNAQKGNQLKNGFTKAVPGFKDLMTKLEKIYGATKKYSDGYITSLVGTRIYVDSFHKLLVYLLQSTEKITCAAAVMLIMERLEAAGIPYIPCIMMHDEADFLVPDEYAEQAAEIGKTAFKDGPALFGIEIMDGDKKIGKNWYEVH